MITPINCVHPIDPRQVARPPAKPKPDPRAETRAYTKAAESRKIKSRERARLSSDPDRR